MCFFFFSEKYEDHLSNDPPLWQYIFIVIVVLMLGGIFLGSIAITVQYIRIQDGKLFFVTFLIPTDSNTLLRNLTAVHVPILLSDYLLLICNNLTTSLTVFSITVMIKFHTWLELQVLIKFIMGMKTTNVYILALYAVFGEINAVSKKLILVSFRTSRKHTKEDLVFK